MTMVTTRGWPKGSGATLAVAVVLGAGLAGFARGETLPRLKYANEGLVVDLGVGLWAWPLPCDYDHDGDWDLLVACPDKPYNGVYFFENTAGPAVQMPVFQPGQRLGPATGDMTLSLVNGVPRLTAGRFELTKFREGDWKTRQRLYDQATVVPVAIARDHFWRYADYDGDGVTDLIVAHGDWSAYGGFDTNDWWKKYNWQGVWLGEPLHGPVFWLHNSGTEAAPHWDSPQPILAGDRPVDVYGRPAPNLADFDADGDLDLLCGSFLDGFTYFQNTGSRREPVFAQGRPLATHGQPIVLDLQMVVPHAVDWDRDGDVDLIVGDEDGRVALVEHLGAVADGLPCFAAPRYFQQLADAVKCGALATPVVVDWDGDGDEDLVSGNTAGYIEFFANLSGPRVANPQWAAPQRLAASGQTIRYLAGPSGSVQGPCEAKWGYTTLSAADWDHDGLTDLVVNSIWGRIEWFRNVGTRTAPLLAAAQPLPVAWDGPPPKPAWNWWNPQPGELVTQWRTTPAAVDFNTDGLTDLVMLDHEGWLCFWERRRAGRELQLLPGRRVLCDEAGQPLQLNSGSGGRSGRRKLHVVDWDGDGKLDLMLNGRNAEFWRQVAFADGRWRFAKVGDVSDHNISSHSTSPTSSDFDGDGRRDLLIGAEDGHFYVVRNPWSN